MGSLSISFLVIESSGGEAIGLLDGWMKGEREGGRGLLYSVRKTEVGKEGEEEGGGKEKRRRKRTRRKRSRRNV